MHHHHLVALFGQLVVGDDVCRFEVERAEGQAATSMTRAAVAVRGGVRHVRDVCGAHDQARRCHAVLLACCRGIRIVAMSVDVAADASMARVLSCVQAVGPDASSDRLLVDYTWLHLEHSSQAADQQGGVLGLVRHVRDLGDLGLLSLRARVARQVCLRCRHRGPGWVALVITLRLLPLIQQQNLLVISQGHALILSHVDVHARLLRVWMVLVHLWNLILHAEVLLNQSQLPLGRISLDLHVDEKLTDLFVLIVGQDQPVRLAACVAIVDV